MKKLSVLVCLFFVLVHSGSHAAEKLNLSLGDYGMLYGGNPQFNKTETDTFLLIGPWGSGALANGQFQDENGLPAWNGWTHYDVTQATESHWQLSDYFADNLPGGAGNMAAWCGTLDFPSCGGEDPDGGYGNSWNDILEFRMAVDNPNSGVTVEFSAYANIDTEPGFDYVNLQYLGEEGPVTVVAYDDFYSNLNIVQTFSVGVGDYQGENSDEVVIQINVTSDGGWSDEDCSYPSQGATQIDDINVSLDQGSGPVTSFTDFEDGWGDWKVLIPVGVGDFSKIWTNLHDIDPCVENTSPQVAFIDDGMVVPGVGPSHCISWCYGPGGYIVNTTGGAVGPDAHVHCQIESPILPWPEGDMVGARLDFSVFRHEDLVADSPGVFYLWGVRSTGSTDPNDIQQEGWADRSFVQYGLGDYFRSREEVSDLLWPGHSFVQCSFTVWEVGYAFGYTGNNGYPAPYFDNIRFICYRFHGPAMSAREIDLANDNFPAIGELDLVNLGNNSVRFDMANTSSLAGDLVNIPGDTMVVDCNVVREDAVFEGDPQLRWTMMPNSLFDDYRISEYGTATSGVSVGVPAVGSSGTPVPGKWAFDLPDSNFLFPGDVLHYFIKATDFDGLEVQSAFMPPDTTGFSDFSRALSYNSSYTVRALPSVFEDPLNPGSLITPKVLLWNDFANRGGENEWHGAFANLGLVIGRDYDCYYTNGPSSGVGNGLGGRATALCLTGYENMVYTSGDLGAYTISNGDGTWGGDPGADLEVLDSWLRSGGKDIFLTGDQLVHDLTGNAGPAANQFVADWLKVNLLDNDLRPLIGNQATPLVKVVAGNGIFLDSMEWVAYGGCRSLNRFDALEAITDEGAIRLAEFTDPGGNTGQYIFSSATYYHDLTYDNRIISLPYDLMYIHHGANSGKINAQLSARAQVLGDVLAWFGIEGDPLEVTPVPVAEIFAVRSYPNPFNPAVKIEYTMPRAGHLSLKVYNVRGQLVRTLIHERVDTSGHIMWDGTDDQGRAVASGVYFTEARTVGQALVKKLTLIR